MEEAANYSLFSRRKPLGRALALRERLGSEVAVRMASRGVVPADKEHLARQGKEVTFESKLSRVETKTDPNLSDMLNLLQVAFIIGLFGGGGANSTYPLFQHGLFSSSGRDNMEIFCQRKANKQTNPYQESSKFMPETDIF